MTRARSYVASVALLTLGRIRAVRRTTVALAGLARGERVLDVGCGTGSLTILASKRVGTTGRVHGVDASPQMLARARRKTVRARLHIDYRLAGAEALPFPDATFDVILSSLMIHHLSPDVIGAALTEMRRVLVPGGRLLVVDLKQPALRRTIFLPLVLIHRKKSSEHGHAHAPQGHPHRLLTALEETGFVDVKAGETGFDYLGFVRARLP